MDDLGVRLKQLRESKGYSLRELGKIAHVSHSFIADIESGRSKPSVDTLISLSKALGVSVSEITGDVPIWKQEQKPSDVELENFLLKTNIYFDGSPLTDDDKEDLLTYLKVKWERERKKKEKGGEK